MAAAAAAAAAAGMNFDFDINDPMSSFSNHDHDHNNTTDQNNNTTTTSAKRGTKRSAAVAELTAEEKKNLNRKRNREHAKSTRARKKAYINKLKELVDGLNAERSEEARRRRVAVQHLAEVQRVRRAVIQSFLSFHADFESDPRKWSTILEDSFYLKQPVTPYRSFRRAEIENSRNRVQEYRISKGINAVIADSASMSVMVENVGNRSARWQHIKRDEFLRKEEKRTGTIRSRMPPRNIIRQDGRMHPGNIGGDDGRMHQHAISSLSSSSGYSTGNGSGGEEEKRRLQRSSTDELPHVTSCTTTTIIKEGGAAGGGEGEGVSGQGGSGNGGDGGGGGNTNDNHHHHGNKQDCSASTSSALHPKKKVTSSSCSGVSGSGSGESSREQVVVQQHQASNNDYHDYHAQPLPDPKLDSGGSAGNDSLAGNDNDSDNAVVGRHSSTVSSSCDEDKPNRQGHVDRKKCPVPPTIMMSTSTTGTCTAAAAAACTTTNRGINVNDSSNSTILQGTAVTEQSSNSENGQNTNTTTARVHRRGVNNANLPPNIARSGGISHSIRSTAAVSTDVNPRLGTAPAIQLPPFLGIGKSAKTTNPNVSVSNSSSSSQVVRGGGGHTHTSSSQVVAPANPIISSRTVGVLQPPTRASAVPQAIPPSSAQHLIVADNDTGSSEDSSTPHIQAFYHVNEDDMLLTDDILMCTYIFRTQDAVLCGALAECVMPGMLRAQFSTLNKLLSLEMIYDAMGFMQQLGRASGDEGVAEIIPNSLDMSFQPNVEDARVITTAKAPFPIVSANATWSKTTKWTQLEIEKKNLSILEGEKTDSGVKSRPGKPLHHCAAISEGNPACSTNVYYDKFGQAFVALVNSYPLTNASDEITHLLHVYKELPEFS